MTTQQLPYLNVVEAAAYLGVSRQRVHLLAQQGRIGCEIATGYYVFTQEELDRYKAAPKPRGGRPKKRQDPDHDAGTQDR